MFFIAKDFSKEIMKRSKLRNNFLKKKTYESRPFALSKEITMYPYQKKCILKIWILKKLLATSFFRKLQKSFTKDKINLIGMRENNKTELKNANVLK